MLFGVFVPPSFPFTFDDSAESERVERTDKFDSDRCRGGMCWIGAGAPGVVEGEGVTSWLMPRSDSSIDANPDPYDDGPAV